MKKSVKKKLQNFANKLPRPKVLVGLSLAILLGTVIYIVAIILLSR